jgi:peroxin-5
MSFLGGAECSTAGNPLSQFTKHVQDDKSLQRDRLIGRGPGGVQEGMRSQSFVGGQDKVRVLPEESRGLNHNIGPASGVGPQA